MRFSDIPLWRRVLIVVVTFAILGVVYWLASLFAASVPVWVNALVVGAALVFAFFAIRHDNRVRRRMEAQGLLKPRRHR